MADMSARGQDRKKPVFIELLANFDLNLTAFGYCMGANASWDVAKCHLHIALV